MRKLFSILTAAILLSSCSNGQINSSDKTNLSAAEFSNKIKEQPSSAIIDVRTPGEFAKGHLMNSINFDWNGNKFDEQIAGLDKSKPVFVYCLSGGRSSSAASKMRSEGFTTVYELDGGIMKWRGANLPETTDYNMASNGMTKEQFEKLLDSDKLVLIDFYADWCAPCKKMKPYLDEISRDMPGNVVVIRIDADENKGLCKELKIDALPVLQVYKNKVLTWTHAGYIEKPEVVKQLQN
jgi:thioredoxin